MNTAEAKSLGQLIATLIQSGEPCQAQTLLAPVLAERTPFRFLDFIGAAVGAGPLDEVNTFLASVAADPTEGSWVVIASALGQQLDRDTKGAFARCHDFVAAADIWYATDILGERVPGPALLSRFEPALGHLAAWRVDQNRWIRRTVGVAAHFWAKRTRGEAEYMAQAERLLAFLEPMFEERHMDAVKGVGWGLKTLGRYYPALATRRLRQQVVERGRPHRALMLRKALTYLPAEDRDRATGYAARWS